MSDPMLKIIPGEKGATNQNRLQDIDANIANIRQEFFGKPEVCHALAGHIVHLRRNPADQYHTDKFWKLLVNYKNVLLAEYDVRWLLSILDTIVDIGKPLHSAIAMNIVQCINGTNIHFTLFVNAVQGNLDQRKMQYEIKTPTWGGMQTADIPTGDMIYNMMTRLDRVVEQDELLNDIWCEIKHRGREENNVIMNHVCKASIIPHQRKFFQ